MGMIIKRTYFNVWKRSPKEEIPNEDNILETIAVEHLNNRTLAVCFSAWCTVIINKEDPYEQLIHDYLSMKFTTKAFNSWVEFFKE